jgi:stage II sporulation protein AA (anti-sigma F factor antagonist)
LEIFETVLDGPIVLHVTGRVNSVNAPKLTERLATALTQGCRALIVDLSRLDHMTSAGFRSLLIAERRADALGAIVVIYGLQGLTLELFEIGGFLEMFTVVVSREEALRRVAASVHD